jgi:hypothetical protein
LFPLKVKIVLLRANKKNIEVQATQPTLLLHKVALRPGGQLSGAKSCNQGPVL